MLQKTFQQLALAGTVCAVALFASDAWKTKDSKEWTREEVQKVLTDSPWAKQITVTTERSGGGQRRGGRGGGMGGGRGGVGFPGGGGGGYPGGGGGYPGGGGGYPGGGGGGRYPEGDGMREEIVLRWESALPVQQALLRQGAHADDESTPAADANQKDKDKYYVIAVLGFRMPSSRRNDSDSSDTDQDRSSQSNDDLRSRFLDAGRLIPKSKVAIAAEDVQFEGRNGSGAIRFLFPKTFPFTAEDKEIVFHFEARGVKFDHKFKLSDMLYQGKLAL
jgi:hypothetical protein